MESLFALLSFAFLVAIPVGLVNPEWVIRWGQVKTREKVVRYYGVGLWAALTLGFAFSGEFIFIEALGANSMLASGIALVIGLFKPEMVIAWGRKEERSRKNVCAYYSTAFVVSVVLILMGSFIQPIFKLLSIIATLGFLIAFIVGMMEPKKLPVLDPFEKRTKKAVFKYYGVGFLVAFLITWSSATSQLAVETATQETQNINSFVIQNNNIEIEENKEEVSVEPIEAQNEIKDIMPEIEAEVGQEQEEGKVQEASKDQETSSEETEYALKETVENTSNEVKEEISMQTPVPVVEEVVVDTHHTSNEKTVYWVSSGEVYHSSKSCSSLSRSKNIYSGTTSESGKSRPCSRC